MAASTRPPAVPAAATPSSAGVIQVRRQQTSNSSRTPGSRSGSCVTPTTVLLLEHSYMQKIDEATAAASAREQETLPSSPWCPRQLLVTLSLNWGISFCTLQPKSKLFCTAIMMKIIFIYCVCRAASVPLILLSKLSEKLQLFTATVCRLVISCHPIRQPITLLSYC